MNTIKKTVYYELHKHTKDGMITEIELFRRTKEEVENATSKENVQFFKQFGNCYVNKTYKGIEWFSRCYNETNESVYASQLYESTETALKRLGLDIVELKATCQKSFYNKAKLVQYKGTTLGLISYDTLVCTVGRKIEEQEAYIKVKGWYSSTTCRHINDFIKRLTPIEHQYGKSALDKGKFIVAKNVPLLV